MPQVLLLFPGSTGRWPVVRGSLPRTDSGPCRPGITNWFCALRKSAFGAAAECYRLAACAPRKLHCYRRLDGGMRIVIEELEIFEIEVADILTRGL